MNNEYDLKIRTKRFVIRTSYFLLYIPKISNFYKQSPVSDAF